MKFDNKIEGVNITTATSTDDILNNIKITGGLKIREIHEMDDWRDHMPIAIVGGGPSLADNLDKLRKYKYIMACGSVYDYLVKNNITPNWCVLCDPDPLIINYIQKAQSDTKFLVASQCDEKVFEYLNDASHLIFKPRVYIWHAFGSNIDYNIFGKDKVLIGGGCTVGTRAMVIAMGMGYNTQHLFGMDTCLSNDYKHHSYEFNDPIKETIGNVFEIKLGGEDSPVFKVAGYMLGQFFDFKHLLSLHSDQLNVTVIGGGLLDYMLNYGKIQAKNLTEEEKIKILDCKEQVNC